MDFDPDHDPLLDDDEVVDFLLYREMERESARPPRGGYLGRGADGGSTSHAPQQLSRFLQDSQ